MRITVIIIILLFLIIIIFPIFILLDFLDMYWQAKIPSCNNIQEKSIVEEIYSQHTKDIEEIQEEVGDVGFYVEEHPDCPEKEYIVIMYGTRAEQKKIQEILGEAFFGVPYRMQNV